VSYNDCAADAADVTGGDLQSHQIYHHLQWQSIVKVLHLTYHLAVVVAVVDVPRSTPAFRLQHPHRRLHYLLVTLMRAVDVVDCDDDDQKIVAVAAAVENDVAADAYVLMVAQLVVVVAVV